MVRITESLIRKKAEHNEGLIRTLEELSLHQENVEKIENLNNWCKDLQILYLQANLIPKIENLNKLKKLQYLNLAINNIETVENLERCESLEKLDLTLNFIGNLESVCSLINNYNLKHLYLTGNPCCDFNGYRQYVINQLPQLRTLDSREITKSERLKAQQKFKTIEQQISKEQNRYMEFRKEQINRINSCGTSQLDDETFWRSSSENCPETRLEIANRSRKLKQTNDESIQKKNVCFFNKEGRPLNINQAKLNFTFKDDDSSKLTLDLKIYKHLDTNLIDIDLQPIYARIKIKDKIFQFVFPEEISTDKSEAKRSQTTGHLVLEMPRANYKPAFGKTNTCDRTNNKEKPKKNEILDLKEREMNISKIVKNERDEMVKNQFNIPPLEYA